MFTHHFAHTEAHTALVPPPPKTTKNHKAPSTAATTQATTSQATTNNDIVLPFIAMGLGVIIIAQDFSSVNVALPAIERDLNSDLSTVQWVINAYSLVFAMLIVAGGRFADLFGRKLVFLVGAVIFAGMSLVGGLAPDVLVLIGARG